MEAYSNLVEAINALRQQGYTEDLNLQRNCIVCRDGALKISPAEFSIDKYFRFEGDSNPTDSSIIYAISSEKHGLKGIMINSYGIYSDDIKDELLEKLK